MKSLMLALVGLLFASSALATVDGHDHAFVVVQHVQDSEEFFVERVPVIGCYGLPRGPQLVQFTAQYKATSNIGCGDRASSENINYLTCAKVTSAKESEDFSSFSAITLDISKCEAKNNPKFIATVKTAARLNFPVKKGQVKLTLVK
jgi:hypothetical protein